MLDLDLDLEADLGVDTVKQAEMFAAIREIYNIPRDENRKLRDYPTLAHVIRFVYERRPDLAERATPAIVAAPQTATGRLHHGRRRTTRRPRLPTKPSSRKFSRLWPTRPAIRQTCSTWISTSKPISASTP